MDDDKFGQLVLNLAERLRNSYMLVFFHIFYTKGNKPIAPIGDRSVKNISIYKNWNRLHKPRKWIENGDIKVTSIKFRIAK